LGHAPGTQVGPQGCDQRDSQGCPEDRFHEIKHVPLVD